MSIQGYREASSRSEYNEEEPVKEKEPKKPMSAMTTAILTMVISCVVVLALSIATDAGMLENHKALHGGVEFIIAMITTFGGGIVIAKLMALH